VGHGINLDMLEDVAQFLNHHLGLSPDGES
jgi:hypothetical protein